MVKAKSAKRGKSRRPQAIMYTLQETKENKAVAKAKIDFD